jgi:hypothetical protein
MMDDGTEKIILQGGKKNRNFQALLLASRL